MSVRGILKTAKREAKTRYYQAFANSPRQIKLDQALISISFDDVPYSALEFGVPLLDKHNIKATFYIASGLCPADGDVSDPGEEGTRFLSSAEVAELDRQGHDIACHTFSHYMLSKGSAQEIEADAKKNVQVLHDLLGETKVEHFSYPFGEINYPAKRLLSQHYKTLRSTRPGLNVGMSDLYFLRANTIYSSTFDEAAIKSSIEEAVQKGGWLIFYTHGVEDNPDPYSCTPGQLDWVLEQCASSGASVLPIAEACKVVE